MPKITEKKLLEEFLMHLQGHELPPEVNTRLITRFKIGRKKYGNDIMEIDYKAEIQQEKDDIIIYKIMQKICQNLKNT